MREFLEQRLATIEESFVNFGIRVFALSNFGSLHSANILEREKQKKIKLIVLSNANKRVICMSVANLIVVRVCEM